MNKKDLKTGNLYKIYLPTDENWQQMFVNLYNCINIDMANNMYPLEKDNVLLFLKNEIIMIDETGYNYDINGYLFLHKETILFLEDSHLECLKPIKK